MARKRVTETNVTDDFGDAIKYYEDRLSQPAPPVEATRWPAVHIGPTWERQPNGKYWLLPERTIGWQALGWTSTNLQKSIDEPWRWTDEQARFLLWWYAVDENGAFIYRDAVLQRLKGWGKDPLAAGLSANEMVGPCRFAEFDHNGEPLAMHHPESWIQTAAVSMEQTKNTMKLFPSMMTADLLLKHGINPGKEKVNAKDGRLIEAVTSSPKTLEGARATLVILNETQHWDSSNGGHDMSDVIERNATKSPDGAARTLRITNAFEPGRDSVAERDRDAAEDVISGKSLANGLLYDSLEAGPKAPLLADAIRKALGKKKDDPLLPEEQKEVIGEVIKTVRGDSVWLNVDRIVKSINDRRNPASRSRRFWYNQITAVEDAWIVPVDFDACENKEVEIADGDEITMFFDGSKSDDATGLMACRMSDGHIFTLGVWQRPPQVKVWNVPRDDVDAVVRSAFEDYKVVAFFADPGSGEDESGERYWDSYIDGWGNDFGEKLILKAVLSGPRRHAVMWDMSGDRSERQKIFTAATERTYSDIKSHNLTHDGHKILIQHVRNARRRPTAFGMVAIGKEHRESARKIDLAVCMIGASMLRRMTLGNPDWQKRDDKKRTGRVHGF